MNLTNYVELVFAVMTGFIVVCSILINLFETYMPDSMKQSFRFGKMAFQGAHTQLISKLEVPKSYFQHFYLYSSTLMLWTFGFTIYVYIFKVDVPHSFYAFLDMIGGVLRLSRVSPMHVILALFLLTTQCIKRFYDSNFVSVFSKNSKINLSHYIAGYIHYTGCAFAIIMEAPMFTNDLSVRTANVHLHDLSNWDILAAFVFLIACYQQFRVAIILGNLRKNPKGKVVTEKHLLPKGGLFNYLSSPHMSCEIVMYICLTVILWGNKTWIYVFAWVLTNQIEVILLNHWWYQATFKEFPAERKALIPFIY